MLKKVGIFWGIKYEPLSDPPVIKICEWGPWAFKQLLSVSAPWFLPEKTEVVAHKDSWER